MTWKERDDEAREHLLDRYPQEMSICEYLKLKVDRIGQVQAYYGFPLPNKISGWQMVCHISKLKTYLQRRIKKSHYKEVN